MPIQPPRLEVIVRNSANEMIETTMLSEATVYAGHTVELTCTSQGGYPHPELTLSRNGEPVDTLPGNDGTVSVRIRATSYDNGAIYQCSASSSAGTVEWSNSVMLNIESKTIKQCIFIVCRA